MKRTAPLILLLLCLVLAAQAQDAFEVPKSKVIRTVDGVEYYIHTVAKGQTVYKISKTYGISAEELVRLNPAISDGLKTNQELMIPTGKTPAKGAGKKDKEKVTPAPPIPVAETVKPADSVPARPCGSDRAAMKPVYDVALIMHFFLKDIDTLDLNNLPEDPAAAYRPFQFIQFYEGFLMAVDSLKQKGLSVRIHVYDVSTDTAKTRKFLQDPELKKMDLMIGLMYHRNFQILAEFAKANRIPLVSPVSERDSQVAGNPMVIKVRPSARTLVPKVASMIAEQYRGANVVIVRNAQSKFRESADQLQRLCSAEGLSADVADAKSMTDFLRQDTLNIVAIFSENKSTILDLLTQLNGIKNQYRLAVYGLPAWDRIDGLEVDYLVNLKTHVVSPYFIDYDSPGVKAFVKGFQETIRTDPDPLAFIGFDVAEYFLSALKKYGTAFPGCMNEMDLPLLETRYNFEKTNNGGYENRHWAIYYYENFRVYDARNN